MNKSRGIYNLIDKEGIDLAIKRVLESQIDFNTYVSPKGLKSLRVKIAEFLQKTWNYEGSDKEILITNGSQQSINLVAYSLIEKEDTVLIEQPTYFGAIDVFKKRECNLVGVDLQEDGFDLNDLENKIKKYAPKAIYVTPTFNNPTGYVWSNKARMEFLSIINKYNILVIEDDPYYLINYTKEKYRTLYEISSGKNIIYLGTFSKLISPSINVGYIVCEDEFMSYLYDYKNSFDLCTSLFLQYVVLEYLNNNNLLSIINKKIPLYKNLLKNSIDSLDKNELEYFTKIKGGLFYLVKFKNNVDVEKYDNLDKFFIKGNYPKMTRINICSYK